MVNITFNSYTYYSIYLFIYLFTYLFIYLLYLLCGCEKKCILKVNIINRLKIFLINLKFINIYLYTKIVNFSYYYCNSLFICLFLNNLFYSILFYFECLSSN